VACGTAALMPDSTGTTLPWSSEYPIGTSGPSWSDGSLASGPTTATDDTPVLSGSAFPVFLSSTIERPAIARAAARWAGVSSACLTRLGSVNGCANMPARYFRVSTCRTSLSIVAMLTLPLRTRPGP
jgi:hypothetical protein